MTIWHLYQKPGEASKIVKEGFNWRAFFFVGLWAYSRGLMWIGAIGLCLTAFSARIATAGDADIGVATVMLAGLSAIYGFFGNAWVGMNLKKRGYAYLYRIEASNTKTAQAKIVEIESFGKSPSVAPGGMPIHPVATCLQDAFSGPANPVL